MRKKAVIFYNVLFPVWFLLLLPYTWLIILPANFLADSIVLILALLFFARQADKKLLYIKTIFKVWAMGFIADLAGTGILLFSQFGFGNSGFGHWWYDTITYPLSWNPFASMPALVYCLLSVAVSGVLIYFFNYYISFKKIELMPAEKKHLAFTLAICTAPFTFLIPTQWIYR